MTQAKDLGLISICIKCLIYNVNIRAHGKITTKSMDTQMTRTTNTSETREESTSTRERSMNTRILKVRRENYIAVKKSRFLGKAVIWVDVMKLKMRKVKWKHVRKAATNIGNRARGKLLMTSIWVFAKKDGQRKEVRNAVDQWRWTKDLWRTAQVVLNVVLVVMTR